MKSPLHRERAKFWCDRSLDNLELLRATYIEHIFSRHIHEGYAIGVIEAGIEGFRYQGANHVAPPSSIVIVHPGEVHTGHAVTKWLFKNNFILLRTQRTFAVGDNSSTQDRFCAELSSAVPSPHQKL